MKFLRIVAAMAVAFIPFELAVANDHEVSDADRALFFAVQSLGSEYMAFEKWTRDALTTYDDAMFGRLKTEQVITAIEANRQLAEMILAKADENIAKALQRSEDAVRKNKKYQDVDRFVNLFSQMFTLTQQVQGVAYLWEKDYGSFDSLNSYLNGLDEKNPLVNAPDLPPKPDKVDLGNRTATSIIEDVDEAYSVLLGQLAAEEQKSPGGLQLYKQIQEDLEWLESNPNPDWSAEPTFELTEGEARITRILEALDQLDQMGLSEADRLAATNAYTTFDFSKDAGRVLWDLLNAKGTQGLHALKIILRPYFAADQTQLGLGARAIMRERVMAIAPQYYLWRTRQPVLDITDFGSVQMQDIWDAIQCSDGCISPRKR